VKLHENEERIDNFKTNRKTPTAPVKCTGTLCTFLHLPGSRSKPEEGDGMDNKWKQLMKIKASKHKTNLTVKNERTNGSTNYE
jgi:hypothetical protein